MDKEFTKKLQEWLNTPAEQRDLEQGALFLLQLTNNKVLHRNISHDLKRHADFLEFKIKRYLEYRLQQLTHDEVKDMQEQVNRIVAIRGLNRDSVKKAETKGQQFRAGKRADHDSLPAEIQALYVENASILQKMRELHLQLRNLSTANSTCPDSDRYPFLTELIKLDKKYQNNWLQYDRYVAATVTEPDNGETKASPSDPVSKLSGDSVNADRTPIAPNNGQVSELGSGSVTADKGSTGSLVEEEAARLEQKNILRTINLTKGRYKKNPTDALKEQILSLYKQITAPSDSLTSSLKELGIL